LLDSNNTTATRLPSSDTEEIPWRLCHSSASSLVRYPPIASNMFSTSDIEQQPPGTVEKVHDAPNGQ
jgi:hypothetical protein